MSPNERLRWHRRERGWTLQDVADRLIRMSDKPLGVTPGMVGDWERGKHRPRAPYPRLLCELYEATAAELGLAGQPSLSMPAESTLETMQRRAFLAGLGTLAGAAAAATTEPWQRLRSALARPRRLDIATVNDLRHVTATLERMYATVSPAALVGTVQGHLSTLTELLAGEPPGRLHPQLSSLAGETAGLAGWVHADLDEHDKALSYYDTALRAAREANDPALGAYLLGSASTLPMFRERSPQTVTSMLRDRTLEFHAETDATPTTRAWLATLEAEAFLALADESGCLNALDAGSAALERPDDEDRARPIIPFFDGARLVGERGLSHLRLGQPDRAADTLTIALRDVDPESKIRARLLTGLATARVEQQEIEEACRLTGEALDVATRTETAPSLQQVRDVRARLEPWKGTASVRELDERLTATA